MNHLRARIHRPGEIVPEAGQYVVVNNYGDPTGRDQTCTQGETFPPVDHYRGEVGFIATTMAQAR